MNVPVVVAALLVGAGVLLMASCAAADPLPRLKVSDNRRFLVTADGRPFFWLADTAWELFHRLDRSEAEQYLTDRAAKGFTVIQAVVLAELDGLTEPNRYGYVPLIDKDPRRPAVRPAVGNDWVLVLDDAQAGFAAPGTAAGNRQQ